MNATGLKIYIAGPMTGYEDKNFPAFFDAEDALEEVGLITLNPAHAEGQGDKTWAEYMRIDLAMVLEADGVCALDGWEDSTGATLEVRVADAIGIPIKPLAEWLAEYAPENTDEQGE